jgi:hypothetical protein
MTINQIRPNIPPSQHSIKTGQPRTAGVPQAGADGEGIFNAAETEFFASMYPQSASEIRSYATYRKGGEAHPAKLGSHIDRKG